MMPSFTGECIGAVLLSLHGGCCTLPYLARIDPVQPARNSLAQIEIDILCQVEGKPVATIAQAVVAIAKLGG